MTHTCSCKMELAAIISLVLLLTSADASHTPKLRSRRHEVAEVSTNDTSIVPADTGGGGLTEGGREGGERDRPPRNYRGWSTWSSWSICSRLCDGGVSHQMRRCKSQTGCRGESTRYRICNMLPCAEPTDFRAQQCAAYNGAIRAGRPRVWTPHYDPERPCALVCIGRPADSDDFGRSISDSDDADQQTESSDDNVDVVIEQLAPQVQVGTRCRPGSLDMCISGRCQHVGCDLRVGSQKAVDACGICGGDGSTCGQPLYHWEEVATSLCSSQCGGGYRQTTAECRNRITGQDVDEALCDQDRRPTNGRVPCNTHRCPAKWTTGVWEPCSVSCGSGWKVRQVYCSEEIGGNVTKVSESLCHGNKPRIGERCENQPCPVWRSGEWGKCSVTCGTGIEKRPVRCVDPGAPTFGAENAQAPAPWVRCDPRRRPQDHRPCTLQPCPPLPPSEDGWISEMDSDYNFPLVHPYPPSAEALIGNAAPSSSTFQEEPWGPCSATCGSGVRRRTVQCRVYLEKTKMVAPLPDDKCSGVKPPEVQPCEAPVPCVEDEDYAGSGEESPIIVAAVKTTEADSYKTSDDNRFDLSHHNYQSDTSSLSLNTARALAQIQTQTRHGEPEIRVGTVQNKTYRWVNKGYTACSASCLGGTQELIFGCEGVEDGRPANPRLCPKNLQPEPLTRTCSEFPCPPRWSYSEFGECTRSCGGGTRIRNVTCVHELIAGHQSIVEDARCHQKTRPVDRQLCNIMDCEPAWFVGNWSACSVSCGTGEKTRVVKCTQIMAQNHLRDRFDKDCVGKPKPAEKKTCKPACGPGGTDDTIGSAPTIEVERGTYRQLKDESEVQLTVGGNAIILVGTSKVRIRCPVRRFDRSLITWKKNKAPLKIERRYKITKNKALIIPNITYADSGTYTCSAGASSENITISVRPRLGESLDSDEYRSSRVGLPETPADPPADPGITFRLGSINSHEDQGNSTVKIRDSLHDATRSPYQSKPSRGQYFSGPPEDDVEEDYTGNNSPPEMTDPSDTTTPETPTSSVSPTDSTSGASRPGSFIVEILHFITAGGRVLDVVSAASIPFTTMLSIDTTPTTPESVVLTTLTNAPSVVATPPGDVTQPTIHLDSTTISPADGSSTTRDLPFIQIHDNSNADAGIPFILGKGSAKNLKFQWVTSAWSECSETCGGNGFQVRAARCAVRLDKSTQAVDRQLCEDAGLPAPETFQQCGSDPCPMWTTGPWSDCAESRCFAWNTAMQRRDVECRLANSTVVDASLCGEESRPTQRAECYNDKCRGVWKVGEWSECAVACGQPGMRYRILQCVWFGTKKPAGTACRDQARPIVMKGCHGHPCPAGNKRKTMHNRRHMHMHNLSLPVQHQSADECRDQWQHCQSAAAIFMCRQNRFQQICCHTCRGRLR